MPRLPSLFSVTRADFGFTRIVVIASTLALVIGVANRLLPGRPVRISGVAPAAGPVYETPGPGVSARFARDLVWTLEDPTPGQRVLAALPLLLVLVCGLGLAWAVWQLLGIAGRNDPVTARAVRYARWLAFLVLALALAFPFLSAASTALLLDGIGASAEFSFAWRVEDFLPLAAGLCLVVLAEFLARDLDVRERL